MKRFAFALWWLTFTLLGCTQGVPMQNGIAYGGTWFLTFTPQETAQPLLFRVEITGQTVSGSYGSSVMCRTADTCDDASERLAQIPKEEGQLRVLMYDGKVITFAGEDTDGVFTDGKLQGTATYLSDKGELSGTFSMVLQ